MSTTRNPVRFPTKPKTFRLPVSAKTVASAEVKLERTLDSAANVSPELLFRAYAEKPHKDRPRKFITVKIFKTKREMRKAFQAEFGDTCSESFAALFQAYERQLYCANQPMQVSPDFGTMFLFRGSCRCGIIAHECFHAAISWARLYNLDAMDHGPGLNSSANSPEEVTAYVQGYLVAQISYKIGDYIHN